MRPKVTVYVTNRNYGKFLEQSVQSVLGQTFSHWELLIFDEASVDDSLNIARSLEAKAPEKIKLIRHDSAKGLRFCANQALKLAKGDYIIRLDADDFFDENALLVLATYLDQHPEFGLVYPNWTYIAEDGEFLGIEYRKKPIVETKVFDLPAHGACTMIRKRVLKAIGGYDEEFDAQDGHEIWMKIGKRFGMGAVETPLFYYRQHRASMSQNEDRILKARRGIKRKIADKLSGDLKPRIIAVVPAKNTYVEFDNPVLSEIAGKPLIDHTLNVAISSGVFDKVLVTTDDAKVVDHCEQRGDVDCYLRDLSLSNVRVKLANVIVDAVNQLEETKGFYADIVVILSLHAPLRTKENIIEAIDTLFVYDVDQVISTYEDLDLHFRHGLNGMEPINAGMLNTLRFERESLYVDNGAVHAAWREFITEDTLFRGRIGHIVMSRSQSFQIKSEQERSIVEGILKQSGI